MIQITLTKFTPRDQSWLKNSRKPNTNHTAKNSRKNQSLKETKRHQNISGPAPRSSAYIHWKQSNRFHYIENKTVQEQMMIYREQDLLTPFSLYLLSTLSVSQWWRRFQSLHLLTSVPAKTNRDAPLSRACHKLT